MITTKTVTVRINRCDFSECGHEWESREKDETPARCARCKKRNWNKVEAPKKQPQRAGHDSETCRLRGCGLCAAKAKA